MSTSTPTPKGAIATAALPPAQRARRILVQGYCGIMALSAVLNIFMLTGSVFMLQVYDRVIPARSVPTLVALLAIVTIIYLCLGAIETVRLRAAMRTADWLDEELGAAVVRQTIYQPLLGVAERRAAELTRPVQDFDKVKAFIGSSGAIGLCDLPWMPLYVAVAFLFHTDLGLLALAGVAVLIVLAFLTDRAAQKPARLISAASTARSKWLETGARNIEAIAGLGMFDAFIQRCAARDADLRKTTRSAGDRAAFYTGLSRATRLFLQSASLALGAYLALRGEISGGMIIAVSIITSRAMAPIELAIGQWRGLVAARQSWERVRALLDAKVVNEERIALPRPCERLSVSGLAVASADGSKLLLSDISFSLEAGSAVAVIGPSGAGKSTLARALVGVLPRVRGSIRLDGAHTTQWDPDLLGRSIGYLPQSVDLLDGTVGENIARFRRDAADLDVIAAAKDADAHAMIVRLPEGYETPIGSGGFSLSGGQRQRIGLARALFGKPFLVVLDEPNSHLDAEGDDALRAAIERAKAAGSIVVVIAHRPSSIVACDHVLVIEGGKQTKFGPQAQILGSTMLKPLRVAG